MTQLNYDEKMLLNSYNFNKHIKDSDGYSNYFEFVKLVNQSNHKSWLIVSKDKHFDTVSFNHLILKHYIKTYNDPSKNVPLIDTSKAKPIDPLKKEPFNLFRVTKNGIERAKLLKKSSN